jgi:hypothetical protein
VKDVPEVKQAREALDHALCQLAQVQPYAEDGLPNVARVGLHQAVQQAEQAFRQAVATAASVEPSALAWKSEMPSLWG